MKTTYVSTFGLSNATRRSVLEMQAELVKRQQEMTTGRVADPAVSLGARTGEAVSLRREHASLETLIRSNAIAASRLDATQGMLTSLGGDVSDFLGTLIQAKQNRAASSGLAARAEEGLRSLVAQLNTTHDGEHIFAGINSAVTPIEGYFDAGSTARQAVEDAFTTRFGFPPSDPAMAGVSADDLRDFLDTGFAGLFDAAAWGSTWSAASDDVATTRISSGGTAATGISANSPAIRKLAMAYTMVTELGGAALSDDAYGVLVDKAAAILSDGMAGVTAMQASLGATQQQISDASERMSLQTDVIARHINALESVDPYEAATRVTTLLTQIETSYAMTARIQQLSLLNYL
jgi:flagellar hook-associated protein 3 FlgL